MKCYVRVLFLLLTFYLERPFRRGTTRSLGNLSTINHGPWLLATYKSWDESPSMWPKNSMINSGHTVLRSGSPWHLALCFYESMSMFGEIPQDVFSFSAIFFLCDAYVNAKAWNFSHSESRCLIQKSRWNLEPYGWWYLVQWKAYWKMLKYQLWLWVSQLALDWKFGIFLFHVFIIWPSFVS